MNETEQSAQRYICSLNRRGPLRAVPGIEFREHDKTIFLNFLGKAHREPGLVVLRGAEELTTVYMVKRSLRRRQPVNETREELRAIERWANKRKMLEAIGPPALRDLDLAAQEFSLSTQNRQRFVISVTHQASQDTRSFLRRLMHDLRKLERFAIRAQEIAGYGKRGHRERETLRPVFIRELADLYEMQVGGISDLATNEAFTHLVNVCLREADDPIAEPQKQMRAALDGRVSSVKST